MVDLRKRSNLNAYGENSYVPMLTNLQSTRLHTAAEAEKKAVRR